MNLVKAVIKRFPIVTIVSIVSMMTLMHSWTASFASSVSLKEEKNEVIQESNETFSFEDRALFRIQNQIYFLTDVQRLLQEVEIYRCLQEHSMLLKAVELDSEILPHLPQLTSGTLKENMPFLERIISLIKVRDFALDNEKATLIPHEGREQKKHCGKGGELSSPALKAYFQSEFLLQERFQESSFWVSDIELKEVLKIDPGINSDSARKIIKQKKLKEALQFYINSLLRQIPHELLVLWHD